MDAPQAPECATQLEIAAAVARLRSHDSHSIRIVEPLARNLTRERFDAVVRTLERRVARGQVENDVGLLVQLLRVALAEEARHRASLHPAAGAQGSRIERLKREEPEAYIRAMRAFDPHFDVDGYLRRYVLAESDRERLRRVAA